MKSTILLSTLIVSLSLMSFTPSPVHVDTYTVDTKLSSLEWFAEKVTGKHNGSIAIAKGELYDNHGKISADFQIDMTTIRNSDLKDENKKNKLETHLKSEDFFSVSQFPVSRFVTTSITPIATKNESGFTHNIKGKLTIKNITNEISFDAIMNKEGDKISCSGTAVVDRSKYDIRYGSKTFFADIGDKMIYDNFQLKFTIVALNK